MQVGGLVLDDEGKQLGYVHIYFPTVTGDSAAARRTQVIGKSYAHFPIRTGLETVRSRIAAAAEAAGRDPEDVRLIAVSKAFPAQAIHAAASCGQRAFGENYAQEAMEKIAALGWWLSEAKSEPVSQGGSSGTDPGVVPLEHGQRLDLEWHFIGPIQSNKTKLLAERFHWVQSVDRARVARRLSDQRPLRLPPLQVCIQVNVSGETSKSGVDPSALLELAGQVEGLPRLQLRGLMTVPEPSPDADAARRQFRLLRQLQKDLAARGFALDTLSMGMSDDLDIAIAEGATMVRVGRAIFGDRPGRGLAF
jgi:pyridoxal phosphate enzyme (YggS family)